MANVVLYKDFTPEELVPVAVQRNKAGGLSIPLHYEGKKSVLIQTPVVSAPFGVSEFTPTEAGAILVKYSMDLSFKNAEHDPKIAAFLQKMYDLDEQLLTLAHTHSTEWFGKSMSREVLAELYRPLVKPSKMPEKYAPTLKLKIRNSRVDGTPLLDAFDTNKQSFDMTCFAAGSQVKAIFDLAPIWFVNKQFGTSCTLLAIEVHSVPSNRLTAFAFCDEDENKPGEVHSDDDM
jgi:hypothetical protein